MFKLFGTAALALAVLLTTAAVPAQELDDTYRLREMANSEFITAERAYRNAREKYGDSLTDMPAGERDDACRKIAWAMNDNRSLYPAEDMLNQAHFGQQVEKLKSFSTALGCTD